MTFWPVHLINFFKLQVSQAFPHQGILWGKAEMLEKLEAYKVRPADNFAPGKFETGTQLHEGQAGTLGVLEYLEWLGETMGAEYLENFPEFSGRRKKLHAAMLAIQDYEQTLSSRLIEGLQNLAGVDVKGISAVKDLARRVPTVSFTVKTKIQKRLQLNWRQKIFSSGTVTITHWRQYVCWVLKNQEELCGLVRCITILLRK